MLRDNLTGTGAMGLVTPLQAGYGPSVPIAVSINGGTEWTRPAEDVSGITNNSADSEVHFEYHPSFTLGSLYPLSGPAIGGTRVTISLSGADNSENTTEAATTNSANTTNSTESSTHYSDSEWNFSFDPVRDAQAKCFFNRTAVSATVVSNTSVDCVAPPTIREGGVSLVRVAVNGVDTKASASTSSISSTKDPVSDDMYQTDALRFVYLPDDSGMSLFPATGPVGGGTAVVISGRHIADAAATLFSLQASDFAGGVNDSIANISVKNADQYPLLLSPSSVVCSFGGVSTMVATELSFDWDGALDAATGLEYGVGHILCMSPPAANGQPSAVDVEVSLNGGEDFTNSGQVFNYRPEAHVSSVEPEYGPVSGETPVRVEGGPFRDEGAGVIDPTARITRCRFGDSEVSATVHSASLISCRAPALPTVPEQQDIEVRAGNTSWAPLQYQPLRATPPSYNL